MGTADDPRSRRLRNFALTTTVIVSLLFALAVLSSPGWTALPTSVGAHVRTGDDHRLARAATELAGRRTRVRCWSRDDWKRHTLDLTRRYPTLERLGPWRGYTYPGALPVVHFSPEICATLGAFAAASVPARRSGHPEALAWSLSALAHEAVHASGVLDEAAAECYGIQRISGAARALGRTSDDGRFLATLYWEHWYPRHEHPYRSDECRNGGALDLHRHTNVWP